MASKSTTGATLLTPLPFVFKAKADYDDDNDALRDADATAAKYVSGSVADTTPQIAGNVRENTTSPSHTGVDGSVAAVARTEVTREAGGSWIVEEEATDSNA